MGYVHLEKKSLQKVNFPVGSTARLISSRLICAVTRPAVAKASTPCEDANFISVAVTNSHSTGEARSKEKREERRENREEKKRKRKREKEMRNKN